MRDRIIQELDRIEAERDVRILFACESGSRAWGFPSQDSDWDVRIVYHHPADWYLDLERHRDVIEIPIADELDISGWDVDKTLRLMRKSNPNILEWVTSPIVYRETEAFAHLRQLVAQSFNHRASMLHYLNMALTNKRQWLDRAEIRIKKYLYTIRPLLCALWVLKHDTQPPMLYDELLGDLLPGSALEAEVEDLVARKVDMNEADVVPKNAVLTAWIDETIAALQASVPDRLPLPDWQPYNAAFRIIIG